MKRQESKVDPVRSKFGKIEKEEVTLPDKLDYVTEYAKILIENLDSVHC
mgnify:CR=1 FL=1